MPPKRKHEERSMTPDESHLWDAFQSLRDVNESLAWENIFELTTNLMKTPPKNATQHQVVGLLSSGLRLNGLAELALAKSSKIKSAKGLRAEWCSKAPTLCTFETAGADSESGLRECGGAPASNQRRVLKVDTEIDIKQKELSHTRGLVETTKKSLSQANEQVDALRKEIKELGAQVAQCDDDDLGDKLSAKSAKRQSDLKKWKKQQQLAEAELKEKKAEEQVLEQTVAELLDSLPKPSADEDEDKSEG